ncbi:MAG: 50S ribosomal protein L21e [Candidatus Nanoarchaeia archaeon]|jgi:large subunit ribosomal protein L21e|nr:50S ribosomal protein L21e [Candidatus Nanoarchaeia archaeon]MDD3993791.1 50S ribosomal protein L21e [Candidatus Nanoarchaeia archaeon]MDD4563437.1 50S ribosomal protein L21e [Candidatus Nanoarchaeia archaeon]
MVKGKRIRQKGKIKLSEYFKNLDDGEKVAVIIEKGIRASFPKRLQGRSGKITGTRGRFKLVEINDKNKVKTYIIHPVHLRRL